MLLPGSYAMAPRRILHSTGCVSTISMSRPFHHWRSETRFIMWGPRSCLSLLCLLLWCRLATQYAQIWLECKIELEVEEWSSPALQRHKLEVFAHTHKGKCTLLRPPSCTELKHAMLKWPKTRRADGSVVETDRMGLRCACGVLPA